MAGLCGVVIMLIKSTLDRGSAEKFGPDSRLCMYSSSDYGSDHYFSVGFVRYFGVSPTICSSVST